MFRLNFQLGKCEFFSDDKGGGTDRVRCSFGNDKLLSVQIVIFLSPRLLCPSWLPDRSPHDTVTCSVLPGPWGAQLGPESCKTPPDKARPSLKAWLTWGRIVGLPRPFGGSRRAGNSRHVFALPQHRAHGRSNPSQGSRISQACREPPAQAQLCCLCSHRGNSTREKGVRQEQAARATAQSPWELLGIYNCVF